MLEAWGKADRGAREVLALGGVLDELVWWGLRIRPYLGLQGSRRARPRPRGIAPARLARGRRRPGRRSARRTSWWSRRVSRQSGTRALTTPARAGVVPSGPRPRQLQLAFEQASVGRPFSCAYFLAASTTIGHTTFWSEFDPVGDKAPLFAVPLVDPGTGDARVVLAGHLKRPQQVLEPKLVDLFGGEIEVFETPADLFAGQRLVAELRLARCGPPRSRTAH